MIEETGIIVKKASGLAYVKINRSQRCEGCTSCTVGDDYALAEAVDHTDAQIGDTVRIQLANISEIKTGFFIYILPLILFIGGFVAGDALFKNQGLGLLSGLVLLALPFLYLFIKNKGPNKQHFKVIAQL